MFDYFVSQSVKRLVYYSHIHIVKTLWMAENDKFLGIFTESVSSDTHELWPDIFLAGREKGKKKKKFKESSI